MLSVVSHPESLSVQFSLSRGGGRHFDFLIFQQFLIFLTFYFTIFWGFFHNWWMRALLVLRVKPLKKLSVSHFLKLHKKLNSISKKMIGSVQFFCQTEPVFEALKAKYFSMKCCQTHNLINIFPLSRKVHLHWPSFWAPLCRKTFYDRNLRVFPISWSIRAWQIFQPKSYICE